MIGAVYDRLTGMAGQLNALGVTEYFSSSVSSALTGLNLSWQAVWALLSAAYFGMHYVFASQTGHVAALYRCVFGRKCTGGCTSD